jgi:outer membrane protein
MKNITLTLLAALTSLVSYAQTEQRTFSVGGNLSAYNRTLQSNKELKTNGFNVSPSVGYFVTDRLAVGLSVGYGYAKNTNYIDTGGDPAMILVTEITNGVSVMPWVKYFIPAGDQKFFFSPSAGVSVDFLTTKRESIAESYTSKGNDYSAFVSPGFTYFPSTHWGVSLNVGGLNYTIENPEGDDNNTSTLNFSLTSGTSVGINYFF